VNDYMVRVVARHENVRGLACITTRLVQEACRHHDAYPTAAVALGRALTGGALMGALLKTGQRTALKFEGSGPLGKIIVEAESDGRVRGYVGNPHVDLPLLDGKFDVAGAIGKAGFLTVTKDLHLKEPYRGIVQLYTSEIAEDIAYYLLESEQIPSAVGLGVFADASGITAAGGFMVQSLPPSDETLIDALSRRIASLPPVTEMLTSGATPEAIIDQIFEGIPVDLLEKSALAFQCSCSRERLEQALISLGRTELQRLIDDRDTIDLTCEFCRKSYTFGAEAIQGLIDGLAEA
jgi:molecular chaperone Hsp33